MARFNYTAEKTNGEVYKGIAEARDRFEVFEIVRREGARILSLYEDHSRSVWNLAYWNEKIGRISEYERVLFARNLGSMLSAGLSLARALSVMERQTKNAKLISVVGIVSGDVRKGETLHTSLAKFPDVFSNIFVAMVRSGEEGGELSASLSLLADQLERIYTLKKKIRGALIYPAIILCAIAGIGVLMMTQVVPTLALTFTEMKAELPASTKLIITTSAFLTEHTTAAVLLFLFAIFGFYFGIRTVLGKRILDIVLFSTPLIGVLVKQVNAARTSRTLASLLTAGVDVLTALSITAEVVQHTYFRAVLKDAQSRVAAGEPLSAAFVRREDVYPPFVGEMMTVGEETGQTAEMLKRLAIFYENNVDESTKDLSTIIEPFLMLLIGSAVGFFAVAMISPIYTLTSHI